MPKNREMVQLNKDGPFRGYTTSMSQGDRQSLTIGVHCGNIKTLLNGQGKRRPTVPMAIRTTIDRFVLGGFSPKAESLMHRIAIRERASRVRQNVGIAPELWWCISISCIGAKAMRCNAMQRNTGRMDYQW